MIKTNKKLRKNGEYLENNDFRRNRFLKAIYKIANIRYLKFLKVFL